VSAGTTVRTVIAAGASAGAIVTTGVVIPVGAIVTTGVVIPVGAIVTTGVVIPVGAIVPPGVVIRAGAVVAAGALVATGAVTSTGALVPTGALVAVSGIRLFLGRLRRLPRGRILALLGGRDRERRGRALPAHLDDGLVLTGHRRRERGVDRLRTVGGGVLDLLCSARRLDEDLDRSRGTRREALTGDLDGPVELGRRRRGARLLGLARPGRSGRSRSRRRQHHRRRRSARHGEQESGAKANSRLATADEHRNSSTRQNGPVILYGASMHLHCPVSSSGGKILQERVPTATRRSST